MKKKLLSLIFAFVCIFAFAGCGRGTTPSGGDGSGTIKNPWWTTEGTLEQEDGKVVFDEVEIDLTTVVNGEDLAAFNQIIAQFNAEYRGKISVISTSVNQANFETTVAQQIANDSNAPDLIMSHQKGHKSFVENKLIQPFNETMEESGIEISLNDYAAGLAQYSNLGYEGYTFGIPADAQSMVICYNKNMLARYGNKLPQTHAELIELCDEVAQAENIKPIAVSTSLEFFPDYVFPTAIVQNGGSLYNTENYYANWASDPANLQAFKDAAQSLRDIFYHTPALADLNKGEAEALNNFLNDRALFYFGMPWNLNSLLEAYAQGHGNLTMDAVKENYIGAASVANMFALESGTEDGNKIFGDSHFFAMSKTVTDVNKKAAICEFVKWFTQTGSVGAAWAEAGHISASTIIANTAEYTENSVVTDYITRFYPDLNYFVCAGNTPYYGDMATQMRALFVELMAESTGAKDETIITSAQDDLNAIIDFILM